MVCHGQYDVRCGPVEGPREEITTDSPIMYFVQFINEFLAPQVVNIHNFSALGQDLLFSLFVECSFSFTFMCTSSLNRFIILVMDEVHL